MKWVMIRAHCDKRPQPDSAHSICAHPAGGSATRTPTPLNATEGKRIGCSRARATELETHLATAQNGLQE